MSFHVDTTKLYKTQWMAYYKNGFSAPKPVYGESEREAKVNALALYRKNFAPIDFKTVDDVVDRVEYIG